MILNRDEQRTIDALHELARKWPASLWLYAANGELHVMKKSADCQIWEPGGSPDPEYIVGVVNIECDGGDW